MLSEQALPAGIHPDFQKWLDGKKTDPEQTQAVVADVRDNLLPLMGYNMLALSDENTPISHCKAAIPVLQENGHETEEQYEKFMFDEMLEHTGLGSKFGECLILSDKLLQLLTLKYPSLKHRIALLEGHDSIYFSDSDDMESLHYFVMLSNMEITEGRLPWDNSQHIYKIDGEQWVLDPALQKAGPIDEMAYCHRNRYRSAMNTDRLSFSDKAYKAYCMTGEKALVSIAWIRRNDHVHFIYRLNTQNGSVFFYNSLEELQQEIHIGQAIIDSIEKLRKKMDNCLLENNSPRN